MGPRASARGNELIAFETDVANQLQWGRARPHAEMVPVFGVGCVQVGLQWGRARPHAEICELMIQDTRPQ